MVSFLLTIVIASLLLIGFVDVVISSIFNYSDIFNIEVLEDNEIDSTEYFNHGIKKLVLYSEPIINNN